MNESANEKFEILPFLKNTFLNWQFVVSLIITFIVGKNWNLIVQSMPKWGVVEFTLIKELISTIFSWPIVTLILVLNFFNKFSNGINSFLESNRIKTPYTDNKKPEEQEISSPNPIQNGDDDFDLGYLASFLKDHTKAVLTWISINNPDVKTLFSDYVLPPIFKDKALELNNVVNALSQYGLIITDGKQKISITDKGKKFIKALGL